MLIIDVIESLFSGFGDGGQEDDPEPCSEPGEALMDGAPEEPPYAEPEERSDGIVDPVGPTDPAPASPAPAKARSGLGEIYPDLSRLTTRKVEHRNLVLEDICTHCAHCGHELTDAISIQRGIGPVCSKKGYAEDPADGDEMQAMIDLSEFPELVEFLTKHYKPLGIRGLINGLVRVASLNRPRGRGQSEGNYRVHAACCDAIASLGHGKLANLLRETLVVVTISKVKEKPGTYRVFVKKRDVHKDWWRMISARLNRAEWIKKERAYHVPFFDDAGETRASVSSFQLQRPGDGKWVYVSNKRALWELIVYCYEDMIVKNSDGRNSRIRKKDAA